MHSQLTCIHILSRHTTYFNKGTVNCVPLFSYISVTWCMLCKPPDLLSYFVMYHFSATCVQSWSLHYETYLVKTWFNSKFSSHTSKQLQDLLCNSKHFNHASGVLGCFPTMLQLSSHYIKQNLQHPLGNLCSTDRPPHRSNSENVGCRTLRL